MQVPALVLLPPTEPLRTHSPDHPTPSAMPPCGFAKQPRQCGMATPGWKEGGLCPELHVHTRRGSQLEGARRHGQAHARGPYLEQLHATWG
jgi:hypothetical protein